MDTQHAPKKPLSFKQAMAMLDVSRTTLERKVKDGTLQKFYLGSKPYLDLEQIEKAFSKIPA
jgi:hypothetical protein